MRRSIPFLAAGLAFAGLCSGLGWTAPAQSRAIPAQRMPAPPAATESGKQVAVLAGGCFWGIEGVFEHVKGVSHVTSGYAGGTAATANYPAVSSEGTNHAEAVRIEYDPAQVSFGKLLQIYFSVAHDPTQVDAQYPDSGKSYRSAIFPQTPEQRAVAARYIAALNAAHVFGKPIATRLEEGAFYPAEAEHQQFMRRNPNYPYLVMFDVPKVHALRAEYPAQYQN